MSEGVGERYGQNLVFRSREGAGVKALCLALDQDHHTAGFYRMLHSLVRERNLSERNPFGDLETWPSRFQRAV